MNNPEFDINDVLAEVAASVKAELGIVQLSYEYGTVKELNARIDIMNNSSDMKDKILPMVYLQEPYDIVRDATVGQGFYGRLEGANIFILAPSSPDWFAKDRKINVFDPVIMPIYRSLINQLIIHTALTSTIDPPNIAHRFTKRYLLPAFNANVDCAVMRDTQLLIYDNPNLCQSFTNL